MPETEAFRKGDRVYVTDPYLAQMREIMSRNGQEAAPNHHGTVEEVWDSGDVLIHFDDGVGAPYPLRQVRHLAAPLPPTAEHEPSEGGAE